MVRDHRFSLALLLYELYKNIFLKCGSRLERDKGK